MSLFDKWFEKKAVKLGYIKEEEIKDPDFEGYCHCMLYYKSLKDE